jgi:hypothetical protein
VGRLRRRPVGRWVCVVSFALMNAFLAAAVPCTFVYVTLALAQHGLRQLPPAPLWMIALVAFAVLGYGAWLRPRVDALFDLEDAMLAGQDFIYSAYARLMLGGENGFALRLLGTGQAYSFGIAIVGSQLALQGLRYDPVVSLLGLALLAYAAILAWFTTHASGSEQYEQAVAELKTYARSQGTDGSALLRAADLIRPSVRVPGRS